MLVVINATTAEDISTLRVNLTLSSVHDGGSLEEGEGESG